MNSSITESAIETYAIEMLEEQGYQFIHGPHIAPDSELSGQLPFPMEKRKTFADVLLADKLKAAVERINPSILADARADALRQVERLHSPELIANWTFR